MHLKVDGNDMLRKLAPLRGKRRLPRATLSACPQTLGREVVLACGDFLCHVPVLDRRQWSATVEFDGDLLVMLARIPSDDLFMDVCRIEFIAGRLVVAENHTVEACILTTNIQLGADA